MDILQFGGSDGRGAAEVAVVSAGGQSAQERLSRAIKKAFEVLDIGACCALLHCAVQPRAEALQFKRTTSSHFLHHC